MNCPDCSLLLRCMYKHTVARYHWSPLRTIFFSLHVDNSEQNWRESRSCLIILPKLPTVLHWYVPLITGNATASFRFAVLQCKLDLLVSDCITVTLPCTGYVLQLQVLVPAWKLDVKAAHIRELKDIFDWLYRMKYSTKLNRKPGDNSLSWPDVE